MLNNRISIVIPVYNCQKTIYSLVENIIKELNDKYNFEIVLVNDCSSDLSEKECIRAFNNFPAKIKFYSLGKNVGEHSAVMAGLNNASGEWAIIMDDDFQNPISELLKLLQYSIDNTFDVVFTKYDKKKHSIFRNIGSRFNDKISNIILNKPNDLYLSSFKAISRKVIDEIIKYDLPFPYLDGLVLRTTRNLGVINVKHNQREYGKSGYTIKKLISLWLNMFTSFSTIPLRVSTILGLFMSALGSFYAMIIIYEKLFNPELPPGYSSTIIFILIFSGLQLIFLGIIGEYLGRLFIAQSKAPQYFITKSFD